MWVVWTKARAWHIQPVGSGYSMTDLYQNNKWKYHATFEHKDQADLTAKELAIPIPEDCYKKGTGTGGVCVIEAITQPVGHNPNWES